MLYLLTQDLGVKDLDHPKECLFFNYDKLGVLKRILFQLSTEIFIYLDERNCT